MNKQKYIEARRFAEHFGDWYTEEGTENGFIGTVKDLVEQAIDVDVVEVVRCKDCKHRYVGGYTTLYYVCDFMNAELKDEGYCSYGERKE